MKILQFCFLVFCFLKSGAQNVTARIGCDQDSSGLNNYTAKCQYRLLDLSTGNPTSWLWDFEDLGSSIAQNPYIEIFAADTVVITLIAADQNGQSDTSYATLIPPWDCLCSGLIGITELERTPEVIIYPNPIQDFAKITIKGNVFSSADGMIFRIYNSVGNLVSSATIQNGNIYYFERHKLPSGIYLIQFVNRKMERVAQSKLLLE